MAESFAVNTINCLIIFQKLNLRSGIPFLDRREKVRLIQFLSESSAAHQSRVMFSCVML